jgi:acyl-CoA synthetase (AMP-forming)/AMP-acid ligase II
MAVSLLDFLTDPPGDKGLSLAQPDGVSWRFHPYAEVADRARRAAGRLRSAGVGRGDVVTLIHPTSIDFVAEFFGALLLGATPSPLAPPTAYRDRETYLARVAGVVGLVRPGAVVASEDASAVIGPAVGGHGVPLLSGSSEEAEPFAGTPPPPEIGLLQFSSGSTGAPRGVRIPWSALLSNLSAMRRWLRLTATDPQASWLPLHHDMGLVGQLLLAISAGASATLLPPTQFVRAPLRWLHCFGPGGAVGTAVPPFGLAHIVRNVEPAQLQGLDLSGWRFLVVGAERIDSRLLASFLDLLTPCGLRRDVLVPAYGLAESTLAVTGIPVGGRYPIARVDASSLRCGAPVAGPEHADRTTELVSCGRPLDGVTVRVLDSDGHELPPDYLGEIEVSGASLGAGYFGSEAFGGAHRTGDAGFLHAGELYVVGRLGDSVKEFGRWVFAEDAEARAIAVSTSPRHTAVVIGELDGRNTAVVLIEAATDDATVRRIGTAVVEGTRPVRTRVMSVPVGTILRTTSGKPMRRAMWQRLVAGELDGRLRWDSDGPDQ